MDKKYITFYKKFILQTKTLNDCGIILGSGVNDESVFQEGKSQESIGRSRSVFSTPTIPTGNQVTKSINKPHYPKSFGNGGIEITRQYAKISTNFLRFNSVSLCRQYYA